MRTIFPYGLVASGGFWYCACWDYRREQLLSLRADRVRSLVRVPQLAPRESIALDRWFDLVFTMGVLIHQPPETLPMVMAEIVRCSNRFVLCGEYFSPEPTEVAYRGETGALFKRDFGGLYQQMFPELSLRKKGFLSKAEGWDDVTYWAFEKPHA